MVDVYLQQVVSIGVVGGVDNMVPLIAGSAAAGAVLLCVLVLTATLLCMAAVWHHKKQRDRVDVSWCLVTCYQATTNSPS